LKGFEGVGWVGWDGWGLLVCGMMVWLWLYFG